MIAMKSKLLLFFVSSLFFSIAAWAGDGSRAKEKSYSSAEASLAIDAFHRAFYDPQMKLYTISSDGKGRAAIWVQAIYWDMVMNAYKRTGDAKYRGWIDEIYQGGYEQYDKFNWNNKIEWFIYDDMMWWIISLARAYELTGDAKFLADAASGFYHVWQEAFDPARGGLWWNFAHDAKMACINYPTIVGSMTLYEITKKADYLEKAEAVYAWARPVFFDTERGRVADNMHYHFQRRDGMDVDWTTQLYNQATFIGSAVMLYKATGRKTYLDDAVLAAEHVRREMCDAEGLLPFKNGVEQGIYAAIFAQYIIRLVEDGGKTEYLDWLRPSIDAAWQHRDRKRNLTFKDAARPCPEGVMESYDASACPALMQVVPAAK